MPKIQVGKQGISNQERNCQIAGNYSVQEKEVQEEMKKLPDETGIATRLSENIAPNGILILESSEAMEIPGLRLIDSYDGVGLYQKVK